MTKSWQDRAIEATRGNGSRLGSIILCALDRNDPDSFPQFTSKAVITSDGYITANFVGGDGRAHLGAFVGASAEWCQNVRALAEHLNLTETERAEFFQTMRDWIAVDYRPEYSRGTL